MATVGLPQTIILSLTKKPMTGYDITKALGESHAWKASHQQIYRELGKLVDKGMVDFQIIPQYGKPDRKLHVLTEAGIQMARELSGGTWEPESIKLGHTHGEATVMLVAGNASYFEALSLRLEMQIADLKHKQAHLEEQLAMEHAELARVDCLNEKALVERDIAHHFVELEYALSAIKTIEAIRDEMAQSQEAA